MFSGADEERREKLEEALEPPNRIDPRTGLPFGWDEENELAGFEELLNG